MTHNTLAEVLEREDKRRAGDEMRAAADDVVFKFLDMLTQSRASGQSAGGMNQAALSAYLAPVFKAVGAEIAATSKRTEGDLLDLVTGLDQRLTALERGGRR